MSLANNTRQHPEPYQSGFREKNGKTSFGPLTCPPKRLALLALYASHVPPCQRKLSSIRYEQHHNAINLYPCPTLHIVRECDTWKHFFCVLSAFWPRGGSIRSQLAHGRLLEGKERCGFPPRCFSIAHLDVTSSY